MIHDELHEQLKNLEADIHIITTFCKNIQLEEQFNRLDTLIKQENFWQNPQQTEILKELQQIKTQYEQYKEIMLAARDLKDLVSLFATDETELPAIATDLALLIQRAHAFKISLLLHGPQDSSNCFLNINAGAGGTEAQDWAEMLLRMYLRWGNAHEFKTELVEASPGDVAADADRLPPSGLLDRRPHPPGGVPHHQLRMDAPHPGGLSGGRPYSVHHLHRRHL